VDERAARVQEELVVLRTAFPDLQYAAEGDWFLIPNDGRAVALGWGPNPFPVAFHAQPNHPGQAPYGIYVVSEARFRGSPPNNFQPTANHRPPFAGSWGVLSWAHEGPWLPKTPLVEGANLLNFALSFEDRYRAGV
jgi:hypothetical protein